MTPRKTSGDAPSRTSTTAPAVAPLPAPRPATAPPAGGPRVPLTATGGVVSSGPTAQSTSPAQAGHNPNVVLARHQMTPAQRRALDRYNAEAIKKRDEVVANYLRSVLPSDDEPAPAEAPTPHAES